LHVLLKSRIYFFINLQKSKKIKKTSSHLVPCDLSKLHGKRVFRFHPALLWMLLKWKWKKRIQGCLSQYSIGETDVCSILWDSIFLNYILNKNYERLLISPFKKMSIEYLRFDSIRNLMLSSKKYSFRGLKCNWKPSDPKNGIWQNKNKLNN
jgi:hypothetical protein